MFNCYIIKSKSPLHRYVSNYFCLCSLYHMRIKNDEKAGYSQLTGFCDCNRMTERSMNILLFLSVNYDSALCQYKEDSDMDIVTLFLCNVKLNKDIVIQSYPYRKVQVSDKIKKYIINAMVTEMFLQIDGENMIKFRKINVENFQFIWDLLQI